MKKRNRILDIVLAVILFGLILVTSINSYVIDSTEDRVMTISDISFKGKEDYPILVLGAAVYGDRLSLMLRDRLDTAVNLFQVGNNNILISGDASKKDYDEVSPMFDYLINKGLSSMNIITDSYGISTYDSIWRLKNIYGYDKVIIVTQKYHLHRALYIADNLGIDAYGVMTDDIKYRGQERREAREILARVKDYFKTMIKPKAKNYSK